MKRRDLLKIAVGAAVAPVVPVPPVEAVTRTFYVDLKTAVVAPISERQEILRRLRWLHENMGLGKKLTEDRGYKLKGNNEN